MLTDFLIRRLENADSPRAIKAITWALEKATGTKTADVSSWYERNGFYRIAQMRSGYSSYSGKMVTLDTALESTALFAGVRIISEDMGSLPFILNRRSKDRKAVDEAIDLPLYRTLRDLVNPELSSGEFVEALTAHALLTGGGYAQIQRIGSGVFLWPWQPQDVRTDRNSNGALVYIHTEPGGQEKTYARTDVFHLRGFTLDCVNGENLLRRGRHALGLTLAAEEYAARYFAQDATPGIVIEAPGAPPGAITQGNEQTRAIKDAWKAWHQGLKNSHEPAVLWGGMKATVLTPKAAESQLVEQRTFQILEVCRLLRLPPQKLAEHSRSTYTNAEQFAIDYTQQTLSSWLARWKRAVHRCLLTVDEQIEMRLYAEHNLEAFQRGDFAAQTEGWRKLLEKGVFSINEVRRMLNLNPVEGGNEHFIQLNTGTVAEIAAGMNLPNANPPSEKPPGLLPVKPKE